MVRQRISNITGRSSAHSRISGFESVPRARAKISRSLRTSAKLSLREDPDSEEENDNDMMLNDVEVDARYNYIGQKEQAEMYTTDFDNLQIWYNMSPRWRRFTLQMIGILVFALLLHIFGFLLSLWMVVNPMEVDPYVCDTDSCRSISGWMRKTMIESVDPCDDFYDFVCGKYRKEEEKESSLGYLNTYEPLKTFKADIQEKSIFGSIFASAGENMLFEQLHIFFRSCLNYTARNEVGMGAFLKAVDQAGLNFEKPTLNLSEIAYEIWNLTSSLGMFDLYQFSNRPLRTHIFRPNFDGDKTFSRILTALHKDRSDSEFQRELEFIFQEALRIGKISSKTVSGSQLATAFLIFQNLLTTIKGQYNSAFMNAKPELPYPIDNKECQDCEDKKKIFNCDVYAEMMDPTFIAINNETIMTHYIGQEPIYGDFRLSFANYMCNGRLIVDLKHALAEYPQGQDLTPQMAFNAYWLLWLYHKFYDYLPPKDKTYLGRSSVFEATSHLEPGAVCVLALKTYMPHLVINRMMKIVGVTKDIVDHAFVTYKYIFVRFREWLNDAEREKTFGEKKLTLYRDVINSYDNAVHTVNFTIPDLQNFGYNESAKLIRHDSFLENVFILSYMIANNDLKRWRFIKGFNPVMKHAELYQPLGSIINTMDHLDPGKNLTKYFIMPTWIFHPLYYSNDLLPLQYGGIWAYFARNVVERWRGACIVKKDFNLDDDGDNGFCSEIKSDERTRWPTMQPLSLKKARNVNDTAFDLVFDLVMNLFKEAADKQKESKKFAFKTLIGFENYTQEQLVFLKSIRHQCSSENSIGTRLIVKDKMLSGLSQSTSFAKVWNCPKGSLMNAPKKCFTA